MGPLSGEETLRKQLAVAPSHVPTAVNTALGPPGQWGSLSMDCADRRSYRVTLRENLLRSSALEEAVGARRALLVTTPTVELKFGAGLRAALRHTETVATLVLNVREGTKSIDLVQTVCAEALAHGLTRRGLIIAVGGGLCSDIVTVAASWIRRGIGHVRVPTTLIGQIDAGIGLKGAVNFHGKKSFIGCFHPPEQVLIDPAFLRTLPARFLVSGLAEAIKMGVVRDAMLFELIEACAPELVSSGFSAGYEVLQRSIWAMLDELSTNPYEDQTWERLVDFGHTFSPALEAALGFEIHHGEAVAVDMALSASISRSLGLIDGATWRRIVGALRRAGLPVRSPRLDVQLCRDALGEARRHRGGSFNLVIPAGIGRAVFLRQTEEIPDPVLAESLSIVADEDAI